MRSSLVSKQKRKVGRHSYIGSKLLTPYDIKHLHVRQSGVIVTISSVVKWKLGTVTLTTPTEERKGSFFALLIISSVAMEILTS